MRVSPLALALVAGTAYGFFIAIGLSWWEHSPPMKLGTAGEWVGGLGTIAAVIGGAISVRWQVKRVAQNEDRRRRLDDDQRIQMLWHIAYFCRADIQSSKDVLTQTFCIPHQAEVLMKDLARHSAIEWPEIPVAMAHATIVQVHERLATRTSHARDFPVAKESAAALTVHIKRWSNWLEEDYNAALLNLEHAERSLRHVLVARGCYQPTAAVFVMNGISYPPLAD